MAQVRLSHVLEDIRPWDALSIKTSMPNVPEPPGGEEGPFDPQNDPVRQLYEANSLDTNETILLCTFNSIHAPCYELFQQEKNNSGFPSNLSQLPPTGGGRFYYNVGFV